MTPQLHHFYHVYAAGQWQPPLTDHLAALRSSGLLDQLPTLQIGLVGSTEQRRQVLDHLDREDVAYTIAAEADSGWEQVTQLALHDYALEHDGYVLYAHTKGASSPVEINHAWRRSMTWHTIIEWRDATSHLADVDAVGCHYINPEGLNEHGGTWFFAGTYWWTHLSYLRRLGPPDTTYRHAAEDWVGSRIPITIHDLRPGWPGFHNFATWSPA